jgi:hypothetical protein
MCQADKAKGPEVHHPDFFATQLMSAVCAGENMVQMDKIL